MADDSAVADYDDDNTRVVTNFLLNTCRLMQRSKLHIHAAAVCCIYGRIAARSSPDSYLLGRKCVDDKVHRIPLITGSSAEFYIQPMLSCVGDVDMMLHRSDQLAIPYGHSPPTELPAELHSHVKVYEIIDSEYPGYVYLMRSYLLTEDSDTGKYNAVRYDDLQYMYHVLGHVDEDRNHGPAIMVVCDSGTASLSDLHHDKNIIMPFDIVPCIRCLSWPPQAADWPTRHRNYDWPDSATIDRVVNNGCDVVHVAHRLCKQIEWMSKYQCRLSFSRAEIVSLNGCMPVQQIVYHMLRFFVKTERLADIKDSSGTKILSNYHIKTLTLWACEVKPQRWWTDDINIVEICVKLFHMFADWLKNKICRHYFVNNCNLFYNTEHSEIIASQLASITESWLAEWFVNSYLRKCAQLCPDRVSRLFDDVSTSMKLQNAVSAVIDRRLNSALRDLGSVCDVAIKCISIDISVLSLTVRSYGIWVNEIAKIDSSLRGYFTALAFYMLLSE